MGPTAGRPAGARGYRSALRWLLGFADWERGVGWNPAAAPDEQWYIGRTRALLDLAGAPDRGLRCVLVAGTKGKGSTATMVESVARAAGWRTGLYTQPHLHTYRERVRLDGQPITADRFVTLVDRLPPLVSRLRERWPAAGEPTTFELTTVLSLLACAEASVDLAILEVGLGGRLDATNAVDPVVSVLTPIGLDHTQILGDTIGLIAREKAGIIREHGVAVSARQRPAARREIVERCQTLRARCRFVGPLPRVSPPGSGQAVRVRLGRRAPFLAQLGMFGPHQAQNAAVAVAVAGELSRQGMPLTPEVVRRGLATARLAGRFEVVPGSPTWVLDAAHNPDSAAALARSLSEARLGRPRWLVIGILADKDARAVARALAPAIDGVVVTAPSSPRALPLEPLADVWHRIGIPALVRAASVAEGLERARLAAGPSGTVVATGSFAVVSEARLALGLAEAEPD